MPNPSHPYVDLSVEDFCDDDTDPYADVRYWSKLPYWTAEEGTALLSNHRAVGRWDRTTLRFSKSLVLDQEKPAIGE